MSEKLDFKQPIADIHTEMTKDGGEMLFESQKDDLMKFSAELEATIADLEMEINEACPKEEAQK